jgi:hypothetical protein
MNKIKFTSYLFETHFNIILHLRSSLPSGITASRYQNEIVFNRYCEIFASSCLNSFWTENLDRTCYSNVILRTEQF